MTDLDPGRAEPISVDRSAETMTRRTAFQSLMAVIVGAMEQNKKPEPITTSTLSLTDWNKPQSLTVSLHWKDITIERNGERVTIDQDELFKALKEKP